MQEVEDYRKEAMGELHNQVVMLVDATILTPPEATMVLRLLANNIERLFEISVKGGS